MNKIIIFVVMILGLSLNAIASTNEDEQCTVALCMAGAANGHQVAQCTPFYAKYFKITNYKKKGRIDWESTFKARQHYVSSCSGADDKSVKNVMSMYGKKMGL